MCLKVTGSDYLLIWRRMCSQEVGYLMFMGMCPNDSGIGGSGKVGHPLQPSHWRWMRLYREDQTHTPSYLILWLSFLLL